MLNQVQHDMPYGLVVERNALQALKVCMIPDPVYDAMSGCRIVVLLWCQTGKGSDGGLVAGIGAFFSYDTRDAVFYRTKGMFVTLSTYLYSPVIGSDYTFTMHRIEMQRYAGCAERYVLAVQGTLRLSTGTPPFQMLFGVGQVVRGYAAKRYTDRHLLAFQIEYRFVPVIWRIGFAVFAGAGKVANDLDGLVHNRFHPAYGAGIRFLLIRSEKINVRWDFGFGTGSSGDYLELNEAF